MDGTNVTGTLTNGYLGVSNIGSGAHTFERVLVAPPVATFSGALTNIFLTQPVTFTNTSTGTITNSVWNFGDGQSATNNSTASVTHSYAAAGNYTVSLIVTGPGGSSTNTLTDYLSVKPRPMLVVALSDGSILFSGVNGPAGQPYRILN